MALDQDGLVQLLMSHRAMLLGYIALIVGDPHQAEDVFQELAVVVFRKGTSLGGAEEFPAWARQVARFKALNALRQRLSAPKAIDESILDLLESRWSETDRVAGPVVSDALRECLRNISPQSRRLIELRYGENLSGKALADRIGQQLNTVYVALSRVYRALAACVKHRMSREGIAYE